MSVAAQWDPAQYNRFGADREKPFWDLVGLVEGVPSPEVVDLGCGDGRLTAALHHRLGARRTTGLDSSPAMLAAAATHAGGGVSFEAGDLSRWTGNGCDLVLSNAALQWVADHEAVLGRWRHALAPGGQLAVQVPSNADHPAHVVAGELGTEWLGADSPSDPVADNVLAPERYAELLDDLGFGRQHVRLQVYGLHLAGPADVVEWVKGTTLTRFKTVMPAADYDRFLVEYRRRLRRALGDGDKYFDPFKRVLLWGRLA